MKKGITRTINIGFNTFDFRFYYDFEDSMMKLDFNSDFFVHIEVYRMIKDILDNMAWRVVSDQLLSFQADNLKSYLENCYNKRLLSMNYVKEFIPIKRSY